MVVDSTFYDRLGVNPEATLVQIKTAHKRKAKKLHPDVNKSPDAQERFQEIQAAYDILSNADKREKYDREGIPQSGPVEVPREVQVRALFRQVMTQILSQIQDPIHYNPMSAWAEHFVNKKNDISMILNKIGSDIVKYNGILERFSFLGEESEENIFLQICKSTIENAEAAKVKITTELATLEDMNLLANKYTYRVDIQTQTSSFQSIHMFRGNFGGGNFGGTTT
jgi:curved DNA-binding protein CbpA